jgi:hypothetical protein
MMRTPQEIAERKKHGMRKTIVAASLPRSPKRIRHKNLNDRRGSWADDPNFDKAVLDFGNV